MCKTHGLSPYSPRRSRLIPRKRHNPLYRIIRRLPRPPPGTQSRRQNLLPQKRHRRTPSSQRRHPSHLQILQNVVSSAAEAETGGIFVGGQQAIPIIPHCPNSTTNNQPAEPAYRPTTPPQKASSPLTSARSSQNPSTCDTGG